MHLNRGVATPTFYRLNVNVRFIFHFGPNLPDKALFLYINLLCIPPRIGTNIPNRVSLQTFNRVSPEFDRYQEN